MSKKVVQTQPFYLQSGIDGTQTSVVVSTITDIYGNQITSMPAGVAFFVATCEPRSPSNQESWKITAISDLGANQSELTVVRMIEAQYPYAPLAGTVPHGNGAECIITNGGLIYEEFVSKDEPSTVTEVVTFTAPNYPRMDSVTPAPTDAEQLVTKDYVDNLVIAGAPDASTTVKGIGKVSVAPASPTSPVFVGDNDPRVPTVAQVGYIPTAGEKAALPGNNTDIAVGAGNKYVTQTGLQKSAETFAVDASGTDAYVVTLSPAPTSYTNGMTITFVPGTTNGGSASLNVNGLGPITILKNGSGTLADGDIIAGQVVKVTYYSGNFQMSSPTGISTNYAVGTVAALSSPAAGNNDVTVTVGFAPRLIKLYYYLQGHSNTVTNPFGNTYLAVKGVATYNGTTLVYNNVSIVSPTIGDDANFSTSAVNDSVPNDPTSTGQPNAGDGGGAFSAVSITLSIASTSSTGFVIRRLTDSSNAGARAKISYEVYE